MAGGAGGGGGDEEKIRLVARLVATKTDTMAIAAPPYTAARIGTPRWMALAKTRVKTKTCVDNATVRLATVTNW